MIENNSGFAIEREIHVKKVKRVLDNWREITLIINSVLLWKKYWYPYMIVAVTTFIFAEFAYYNPSIITSVGLICLTATIVDFGGPSISSVIWRHEDWSTAKEREFEEICRALAECIVYVKQSWAYLMDIKTARPTMYNIATIASCLFLALIGNAVNNIFVLYIICLSALMIPGLLHFGLLQKYYRIVLTYVVNFLRSLNSSCKPKVQ